MKTALIAGASGLTGTYLLQQLLKNQIYDQVKILVRKPLDKEHPNLQQIVYDYENPDTDLVRADHVYCCLGTTMKKAGSKEAFKRVDHDYPLELARAAYENGSQRFALVSAVGANAGSMFFYNQVKGQLEEALRDIPFEGLFIMQPSMLLGPRKERRLGEQLGKAVMKPLSFLLPGNMKPVHVSQVAAGMIDHMNGQEEKVHIISSSAIRKYPVMHEEAEIYR